MIFVTAQRVFGDLGSCTLSLHNLKEICWKNIHGIQLSGSTGFAFTVLSSFSLANFLSCLSVVLYLVVFFPQNQQTCIVFNCLEFLVFFIHVKTF